ncbi:tetratricopeptide repeat protein [Bacteroides sp. 51]|uniref:tetratricopeptide repeat protein n=1 Tax=Bacteroides sp. 51 TaxID=2302938 RepID=UPI0013CFE7F9|nr:tetratricopeptide repeat protein [Bacteroides sp. 51]NDV84313.1 hypothetical protein [Bacteroides sp. 51]
MKQVLILFCFCISLSTMAQQQAGPIREAMANYDYETALGLISKETPTPQLTFQKAQALRGLNRYREALEAFREVVAGEPENLRAIIEMAECCKLSGRFTEGLKSYEQALALTPENKYLQLQRISLLCIMEQYAQARRFCHEVMANDSSTAVMRLMAQAQEGLMRPDSALYYYKTIVEKEPHDYLSVAKLANLHINTNAPQEAITVTEKYREKDSTNIYVNRQNAQAYCLTKDYRKAIDRYEYLVNQGDSTRMTSYYLGMSYYAIEDYYGAHDFLRIAYKYDPKNINVLYYLGRACAKTSWKKEGVAMLNEAINLAIPSDSIMINLYNGLADCCYYASMYKEQVEAYKEIYKYNPRKKIMLYTIGAAYQDYLKDNKNAEKYLELFLKTKPKGEGEDPKMEKGTLVLGEMTHYTVAERRLNTIRKEQFFKEGQKE